MTDHMPVGLRLEPFQASDQAAVQDLILAGMAERWGKVDRSLNSDLDDIATSYADATVLVARLDGDIVGVGALVPVDTTVAEIKRMHVTRGLRRHGIGRAILDQLCARAAELGLNNLVLETSTGWDDAIAFYLSYGFQISHQQEGGFGHDTYFVLDLADRTDRR